MSIRAVMILCLSSSMMAAESGTFIPFQMHRQIPDDAVVDLSGLLHKPAGKYGRIQAHGTGFKHDQGPIRFWGVNMTYGALFPDGDDAVADADRLSRLGVNMLRIHHADARLGPKGLVFSKEQPQKLHPEGLDRLHRLMAECAQRGVYLNINLHVSRQYWLNDDGSPLKIKAKSAKGQISKSHHTELLKSYAKSLLTTVNPYTGMSPAEDPAVAVVEISNENNLKAPEWYRSFAEFIRQECAYAGLIAGSHQRFSKSSAQDVEIENDYWNHPDYAKAKMSAKVDGSIVTGKGRTWAKGAFGVFAKTFTGTKPQLVTEYNHAWPNFASAEAPLAQAVGFVTTKVGGITHFGWANGDMDKDYIPNNFSTYNHAAAVVHFPAVAVARFLPGISGSGLAGRKEAAVKVGAVVWHRQELGQVLIKAPSVKGFFGFPDDESIDLGDGVSIQVQGGTRGHCAFSLVHTGCKSFPEPGRYILALSAESRNTAQRAKDPDTDIGHGPVLAEILAGTVDLRSVDPSRVTFSSLDPNGRVNNSLPVIGYEGGSRLALGAKGRSIWYVVDIR